MNRYEVAFRGELVPGTPLEQVQANLARLFQADAQRIAALFSGRRVVIKQNLDAEAAEKYRVTLERAGARVEINPIVDGSEEIELTAPAESPDEGALPATPAARLKVAPRDEYMAAFADVDAPDFGLAEPGTALLEPRPEVAPPPLDLSAISLAPVGSDLGQLPADPAPPVPDISHIKLA